MSGREQREEEGKGKKEKEKTYPGTSRRCVARCWIRCETRELINAQRCSIGDRKCIGIEDNQCASAYVCMCVISMAGQTILLLECSCQVTGYVKDIRCAQVAPVLLSVCVCLIFPLAKMINALGDNIRYSLFTYSFIHSALSIQYSLISAALVSPSRKT